MKHKAGIDPTLLQMFAALARGGNLRTAASEFGASDATIMRGVSALEDSVGARLFIRRRTGHELTAAGRALLPSAESVDRIARRAAEIASTGRADPKGRVIITTTEFGGDFILLPYLAAFARRNPGLSLSIETTPSHRDLERQDPVIALRFARPDRGEMTISKLGDSPWAFYVARKLLRSLNLAEGDALRGDEPFIGWAPPVDQISVARAVARVFPHQLPVLALSTLQQHLGAARSGIGVAHLPRLVADKDPKLALLQSPHATSLEAWLALPVAFKTAARVRIAAAFVRDAFRAAHARSRPA